MRRLLVLALAVLSTSSCLVWKNQWRHTRAVRTADDVAYADADNDKQRLDIYAPEGATGVPVVIFVHGGYWVGGDRSHLESITGLYGNVGTALADTNVVTVIPSYRLYPEAQTVDDMLDDIAAVVRFTKDHIAVHGGDPARITLAGHSAGAHLVSVLAQQPGALEKRGLARSDIKGVVAISGFYDLDAATAEAPADATWPALFGAHRQDESPARLFGPAMIRTFFMAGDADYPRSRADFDFAQATWSKLEGDRVFFRSLKGFTHEDMVLRIGTVDDEVGPAIAAFAWLP
jgi:acetyl esterase/lipase